MIIQCPECEARYRIDPSRATKTLARVKCPQCAAVFEVDLVRVQAEPTVAAVTPAGTGFCPEDSTAALVLIVDDSKYFRELIAEVLKPLQLCFLMAGDGDEALRIIRQQRPALVILDLNLPGMNGYELIRQVRVESALQNLRLLAMSGVYRKEADAAEVQAAGADDFVSKSFKPEQLQVRVRKLLADQA
jgi:predicted Zn finger-like uncharacterized protein